MRANVEAVFWQHKRRCGATRIAAQLQGHDVPISLYKTRKLLRARHSSLGYHSFNQYEKKGG